MYDLSPRYMISVIRYVYYKYVCMYVYMYVCMYVRINTSTGTNWTG